MSWLKAFIGALGGITKLIDAFREMWWAWETNRNLRRERKLVKENDEIHDEIANGGRPTWDNRK